MVFTGVPVPGETRVPGEVAGIEEGGKGFIFTAGDTVAGWRGFVLAVLVAGTRRNRVDEEGSGLEAVGSDCTFVGATGGLILILLVTVF